jgi:hypothetical protein
MEVHPMFRPSFSCLAGSLFVAAACNPQLSDACANDGDCNVGRACVSNVCRDTTPIATTPSSSAASPVRDDPAAIAVACSQPQGIRYTAKSGEELASLLVGRWAPCPNPSGRLPDPKLHDGFIVEGATWRYKSSEGGGSLVIVEDPDHTSFALESADGVTRSLWGAFDERRQILNTGPRPVTSSGEVDFVRVEAPAPAASTRSLYRRADGGGPIGNVALVNRSTTTCAPAIDAASCPLAEIAWNGLDQTVEGFDPDRGWYTGETLVAGRLEGQRLIAEQVYRILGGILSPLAALDERGDGPPLLGTFGFPANAQAALANETSSACPSSRAAACSVQTLDVAEVGLTPDQTTRARQSMTRPGELLVHGKLDAAGVLRADAVWIDVKAR